MDYATGDINNIFMSLDHNSLLYNLAFINVVVPLIAHTMFGRLVEGNDIESTS
jgi:hypothetical protein